MLRNFDTTVDKIPHVCLPAVVMQINSLFLIPHILKDFSAQLNVYSTLAICAFAAHVCHVMYHRLIYELCGMESDDFPIFLQQITRILSRLVKA